MATRGQAWARNCFTNSILPLSARPFSADALVPGLVAGRLIHAPKFHLPVYACGDQKIEREKTCERA